MSFGGLSKQFHKASQFMSEKMGETDTTKMEDDYLEMEKKVDETAKAVQDLINYTKEYLQPNPAMRARMAFTKLQSKQKDSKYSQAEGVLGESMIKHADGLKRPSNFGKALQAVGEGMKQLAEVKDSLDIEVKQDFIDPLQQLNDKDIKEVMHHRKKVSGRRLDYDYKRNRGSKVPPEEIAQAEQKLEESLELADSSMHNLLSSDVEQVRQLDSLVTAQLQYHNQSVDILNSIKQELQEVISDAQSQPEMERSKRQLKSAGIASVDRRLSSSQTNSPLHTPSPSKPPPKAPEQPSCKGLYDFVPENEGELGFMEGEIITLTSQIDDNWFEGMNKHGQSGYFPVGYVDVLVALP